MTHIIPIVLASLMVIAAVGMHSAACGMHVSAVEGMWRRNLATHDKYVWSHAYCTFMSAPLRLMKP